VRPSDPLEPHHPATSYDWSVPVSNFPKGNYIIRIEAYRDQLPLHYAFTHRTGRSSRGDAMRNTNPAIAAERLRHVAGVQAPQRATPG